MRKNVLSLTLSLSLSLSLSIIPAIFAREVEAWWQLFKVIDWKGVQKSAYLYSGAVANYRPVVSAITVLVS